MRLTCWPFEVEEHGVERDGHVAEIPATAPGAPPAASVVRASVHQVPAVPVTVRPPLPAGLPLFQEAHYDIRYGILGSVGGLTVSVGGVIQAADGSRVVKLFGGGEGSVLGIGGMRRTIETDFDPVTLESRRWTILRARQGQPESAGTRDTAARESSGQLLLDRTISGQPASRQTVTFKLPTSDPLGLLWRLRTAPPEAGHTEILQLLDGPTLWRVRVTAAEQREILPDSNRTAIRLSGEVSPILYDGQPDDDRPTRQFTLWLTDAADHLPLRLEVPVGIADVVMRLTETRTLTQSADTDVSPGAVSAPGSASASTPASGAASVPAAAEIPLPRPGV